MTEPLVCVPKAMGTCMSATAAAEPEEEPPGVRVGSWGLCEELAENVANSVVSVLPIRSAPRLLSWAMQAASAAGWLSSALPRNTALPYSVGKSRDWMMSLAAKGMPNIGESAPPASPPLRIVSRAAAASSSASRSPRCAHAPTSPSAQRAV